MPIPSPVLVTGAGGFIGSHLVECCVQRGLRVRAFVHYNANNSWGWLDRLTVREELDVIAGDIRDFDAVSRAVQGCGTVFHLAALIGIPYSYRSPLAYVRTNIEGTYNILEAARIHRTPRVVVTSTSETYGTAQYVPIDEKHPVIGQSPYAATKIAADQLALSYFRSFDLPVWVVRPFNTYGPRQSARAFIPNVVSQLLAGCRKLRLGNLSPTRDLTFVKDTAAGFLSIAAIDDLKGSPTNIGMNEEIEMGEIVERIAACLGVKVMVEVDPIRVRPDRSEVQQLRCDNTRIMSLTAWKPAYTLNRGLDETIEWIRKNINAYKPNVYNV